MQLEFTNSTGGGSICECASRTARGVCWRRWLRAGSRHPSWWWFQRRQRPLSGDRRPQTHRRAGTTGPGHGGSHSLADEHAEALVLSRSLRFSPQESALEQGWLLWEMEQRFGCSLDELARRFDRSTSWVSRRLALVELLPEAIQRQVREGNLIAQVAMKYLVPIARVNADDCERMAAAFVKHRCDTREAAQLYTAWREGSRVVRERILAEPELFLKTQRQPLAARPAAVKQVERDLEMALVILHRAGRRLSEALPEMNGAQQEQTQGRIESARRELNRMAERIGKEQEAKHTEPGATNRDSGVERAGSEPARDRARAAGRA